MTDVILFFVVATSLIVFQVVVVEGGYIFGSIPYDSGGILIVSQFDLALLTLMGWLDPDGRELFGCALLVAERDVENYQESRHGAYSQHDEDDYPGLHLIIVVIIALYDFRLLIGCDRASSIIDGLIIIT